MMETRSVEMAAQNLVQLREATSALEQHQHGKTHAMRYVETATTSGFLLVMMVIASTVMGKL